MKRNLLLFFAIAATSCYGQTVISSVNSGAVSNNEMAYSVGEIFVNPESNPDQANSGLMGILSRVEFFVGIDDQIVSDDLRVLPNPVSNTLFFETNSGKPIGQIFIYDLGGKLVLSKTITGNKADLSTLPNGTYLIQTNIENIQSLKIIKQ